MLPTSNRINPVPFEQIVADLTPINDQVWGQYAFSRELLNRKLTAEQRQELITASIEEGERTAEKIQIKYPNFSIAEVIAAQGVKVEMMKNDDEVIGSRILFALYTPPKLIQISKAPIQKIGAFNLPGLAEQDVENMMLAHELFHHIESHDKEMYTQKTKIVLWKFLFYSYKSTVRATSEIAAMAFSRTLNQLKYSPFMLDILLFYSYDPQTATKMYYEVMDFLAENS